MICPKCHNEIADGVKFCKFCGTPIASEAPATAPVAQPAPAEIPQPAPAVTAPNSPYANTQAPNQGMPYAPYGAPSPYTTQPPVEGMPVPDGNQKKKKKKMSKGKKAILAIFLSLLSISIIGAALLLIFFPLDRFYVSEEVTIYYYEDGEDNKYEYTYNKDGNPLKIKQNGETIAEYEYDKKGKLTSITTTITNDDGEEEKETFEYKYEKTKDGMVGTCEVEDSGMKEEVTYNKANKLVKHVIESNAYTQTSTYEYNFFGYMTYSERTRTDNDGNETKGYYHYDYKGEPVLSETYSNGVLTSSYKYEKGILVSSSHATETDIKDGKTYVLEYENCFYDENGNLIREEIYDADDNLIAETIQDLSKDGIYLTRYENDEIIGYIDCELDKDGNIIKEEWLSADKEVILCYEYEYDKYGNCIEEKDLDKEGNLESKTEKTYKRKPIFNW